MPTDAEWLTRRPADNNRSRREGCVRRQCELMTFAPKISSVGFAAISLHFVADCPETLRFKPERKTAATREQIQDQRIAVGLWNEFRVQFVYVFVHVLNLQASAMVSTGESICVSKS